MKNLLLLFALLIFNQFYAGDFQEAKIKFSNGKEISGLVKVPKFDDKKIKFKANEDAKKEEFEVEDLDRIEFYKSGKLDFALISTKAYSISFFKRSKTPTKQKGLLQELYIGKLKIYFNSQTDTNYRTNGLHSVSSQMNIFFQRPTDDFPSICCIEYGGMAFGGASANMKVMKAFFEKDCPKLVELLDKKEFKEKSYPYVGELYDKTCGKTE